MVPDSKKLSVTVPKQVDHALRELAQETGISVGEALRNLTIKALDEQRIRRLPASVSARPNIPTAEQLRPKSPPKKSPAVRNRAQVLRYSKAIVLALQEALDYDPVRQHNQPPPELRLEDEKYLEEIRNLVTELKRLNLLLETANKEKAKKANATAIKIGKHFDKFFGSYASALGKGTAGLTIAAAASMLYHAGLGKDLIDNIWGHLKLPK
jgi:ADP-ribose pyrophosphatase YjhB (NUDIX family)